MNEESQLIAPPVDGMQDFLFQCFMLFSAFLGFSVANIAIYFYLTVGRVERHTQELY